MLKFMYKSLIRRVSVLKKVDTRDLVDAFRKTRNQCLVDIRPEETKAQRFDRGYANQKIKSAPSNASSDKYISFQKKYDDLENKVDSFNTQDLVYFFREKARESGFNKYVISNMRRDMGIFKRLKENYEPREICLMIEFIFNSEQNYLDKSITQPTVLASGWGNKIYQDSLLWVDDKYVPTKQKAKVEREWQKSSDEESAEIGGWE